MLFKRTNKNLPADPAFEADLTNLGYKRTEEGKFVKILNSRAQFTYFISNNERVNETHKEAMHEAVRAEVLSDLAKLGVKKAYLSGKEGTVVAETKPKGKQLPILTSDLKELKGKRDIVILIGEHTQDLGVLAWRSLLGKGGKSFL